MVLGVLDALPHQSRNRTSSHRVTGIAKLAKQVVRDIRKCATPPVEGTSMGLLLLWRLDVYVDQSLVITTVQ